MSKETEDLETHTQLCALRYQGIQDKFDQVDQRLDNIDRMLAEIKTMILEQRDAKFKTLVGASSTVIVGLLGVLGYLISHLN